MVDAMEEDSAMLCTGSNVEHTQTNVSQGAEEDRQRELAVPPDNKRKRKPVDRGLYLETEQRKKTVPRKPKKKQADAESEFETVWICVECKEAECMMKSEATELLICDGLCRRLFHYPCAGLDKLPAEEEEFICEDCQNQKHTCAICSQYGADNEDVFKCIKSNCGLFFHESCLSMQNVDVEIATEGGNEESGSVAARPRFVCPAHSCWTCTQTDLKEREKESNKSADSSKAKRGKGTKKAKSTSSTSFEMKSERFMTVSYLLVASSRVRQSFFSLF